MPSPYLDLSRLSVFYHNASPVLCTSISPPLLVTCLCGEAFHSLPSQVSFEVFHAALLQDTGVTWEGGQRALSVCRKQPGNEGGICCQRTILNRFSLHLCMSCTWQGTASVTRRHRSTVRCVLGYQHVYCLPVSLLQIRDAFGATSGSKDSKHS